MGNNMTRSQLEEYIAETFNAEPEHPWAPDTDHTVFRHRDNRKWFAVVMEIPRGRLGLDGEGGICIVNLKCDPVMIGSLLCEDGMYPAWHMNKSHWISAAADDCPDDERLKFLIDLSFDLTAEKQKRTKRKEQ